MRGGGEEGTRGGVREGGGGGRGGEWDQGSVLLHLFL